MTAEIEVRMVKRYEVVCTQCDVHMGTWGRASVYMKRLAQRHDKYCHGEPIPHKIESTTQSVIWTYHITCICGATGSAKDAEGLRNWRCPLDRSIIET